MCALSSWWQLGQGVGRHGDVLSLHDLTCAFCLERGNFEREHHAEKKQPNGSKVLNFDTYRCGNCAGYVMVLWASGGGLHQREVLPWPLRLTRAPEHWPEAIGRYWLQAKRSLRDENWDAAATMARSALQLALRDGGAQGANLKQEVNDLASKGTLPPLMKEWSHEVRELGNESAHPDPDQPPTSAEDARDVVQFLDYLLQYLYTLPHQIEKFRNRRRADAGE